MGRWTVYLRIERRRDGGSCPYRGAGTYGVGDTEEQARKVAKQYLRESFGSGLVTTELVQGPAKD